MKIFDFIGLALLVQMNYGDNNWLLDKKLSGNSLQKRVASEKCYSICTEYFNCFGVSYYNNVCYMFDFDFKFENQKGWQSMLKRDLNFQTPFINQNLKLFESYNSFVTLESSCWRACKIDPKCFAIAYNQLNIICNLFNSSYGFERTQGWKTYTISDLNFMNYIESQNIRLDNHYKKNNIISKEKCWLACLDDINSCVAVSFNEGICYFYNSGYQVFKEYGSITLTTRNIQLNNPIQYNNTFLGFGFQRLIINKNDYNGCLHACLNTNICVGISYNESACYLNDKNYVYERLNGFTTLLYNKLDRSVRFIYDNIKIAPFHPSRILKEAKDIDSCWSICLNDNQGSAIGYGMMYKYYNNENPCICIYDFILGRDVDPIARFISIKRIDAIMSLNSSFEAFNIYIKTYQNIRFYDPIAIENSDSIDDCWKKCGKSSKRCGSISFNSILLQCLLFDSNFLFEQESEWISWTTFDLNITHSFVSTNSEKGFTTQKK